MKHTEHEDLLHDVSKLPALIKPLSFQHVKEHIGNLVILNGNLRCWKSGMILQGSALACFLIDCAQNDSKIHGSQKILYESELSDNSLYLKVLIKNEILWIKIPLSQIKFVDNE